MMAIIGFVVLILLGLWFVWTGGVIVVASMGFTGKVSYFGYVILIVGVMIEILAFHYSPFYIVSKAVTG